MSLYKPARRSVNRYRAGKQQGGAGGNQILWKWRHERKKMGGIDFHYPAQN